MHLSTLVVLHNVLRGTQSHKTHTRTTIVPWTRTTNTHSANNSRSASYCPRIGGAALADAINWLITRIWHWCVSIRAGRSPPQTPPPVPPTPPLRLRVCSIPQTHRMQPGFGPMPVRWSVGQTGRDERAANGNWVSLVIRWLANASQPCIQSHWLRNTRTLHTHRDRNRTNEMSEWVLLCSRCAAAAGCESTWPQVLNQISPNIGLIDDRVYTSARPHYTECMTWLLNMSFSS